MIKDGATPYISLRVARYSPIGMNVTCGGASKRLCIKGRGCLEQTTITELEEACADYGCSRRGGRACDD
jgi:hypothetical protein